MPRTNIVNAGVALFTLLGVSGCNFADNEEAPETLPSFSVRPIWQTSALPERLSGLGVLDGASVRFAYAFENSGLSIRDVDGVELAEEGPDRLTSIADGVETNIDGVSLTVFPGVNARTRQMGAFVFGTGLVAPIEVGVTTENKQNVLGLCAAPTEAGNGALRLAYWADNAPATLVSGVLRAEGNSFIFAESARDVFEKNISSCDMDGRLTAVGGGFGLAYIRNGEVGEPVDTTGVPVSLSVIDADGAPLALMSYSGGQVYLADGTSEVANLRFEDALSVSAPEEVGSVDLVKSGSIGSFPNGIAAFESLRSGEPAQVIYVDLGTIKEQIATIGASG